MDNLFAVTLLKIKVLYKVLYSDAIEEPFLVPQRAIQSKVLERTIFFLPFYNLKNLLSKQRTFGKWKGSSDVKGSLWNHLDKKGSSLEL